MNTSHRRAAYRHFLREGNGQLRCAACMRLVQLDAPADSETRATLDHIIPVSKGGTSDKENLQIMCRPCNMEKGNQLPKGKPLRVKLKELVNK